MQFKRCPNPDCGRPFQINQFTPRLSHPFELGKVTCPHCGQQFEVNIEAVFLTHALSAAEEAEFNAMQARMEEKYGHANNGITLMQPRQTIIDDAEHGPHLPASGRDDQFSCSTK